MSAWPIKEETVDILKREEERTGKSREEMHNELLFDYVKFNAPKDFPCTHCGGHGSVRLSLVAILNMTVWEQFEYLVRLQGRTYSDVYHEAVETWAKVQS